MLSEQPDSGWLELKDLSATFSSSVSHARSFVGRQNTSKWQICRPSVYKYIHPPFTDVGVDVFGPWEVTPRRTRGGHANNKRWAVMFLCICTRAVHIEVIEAMSSISRSTTAPGYSTHPTHLTWGAHGSASLASPVASSTACSFNVDHRVSHTKS